MVRDYAAEFGGAAPLTTRVADSSTSLRILDASGRLVGCEADRDLPWDLLEELWEVEAHPEEGGWLYLRVAITSDGEAVDRAYDHWPTWQRADDRHEAAAPIGELRQEMARRAPQWRPDWMPLLDEAVMFAPPWSVES
ncbi:hypothetical protein CDO52_04840 [Nocardiopsis gilva YIM 90087]|uniref:Uncharacterized protein n=1 Tax=Nocardiopsis gilva YIM 90087 TaxID=1235441 RepID=A0A223S250_9ACTN|nr:hypothetical protein CDO52_04840 [Nocardiopsis gilva YIM 90087]